MQKDWFRLDTAALIFPAITGKDWCNVFRFTVNLKDDIDPAVLQQAVDDMATRFPSFFVSLRRGFFWCYLEKSRKKVTIKHDFAYPLTFMSKSELKKNCMRVLYYKNRIAVEFFHSLTDGRGGSIFLSNLAARYVELKYGTDVPHEKPIVDLLASPTSDELEDSFLKNAAEVAAAREKEKSYKPHGTKERLGFKNLITGIVDTSALLEAARIRGVSVTAFLSAVMAESVIKMQNAEMPRKKQRPVKITVPIDLRRLFNSNTVRNFALVLNLGVDPRFGDYTLDEICNIIYHQLRAGATPQYMAAMIAANVQPQEITLVRLMPLPIKTLVMRLIYLFSGEIGGCINVSNLGVLELPKEMRPYVSRMDFIIGPQRSYPNNCSVLSYGGKTYINMIRNIRESELERLFFSRLVELGIAVEIESSR